MDSSVIFKICILTYKLLINLSNQSKPYLDITKRTSLLIILKKFENKRLKIGLLIISYIQHTQMRYTVAAFHKYVILNLKIIKKLLTFHTNESRGKYV